jgi:hypothetical protein
MDEKKGRIKVKLNHEEEGFFTDNVTVFHNPSKFVVDFSQTIPRFDNIEGKMNQTFVVKHRTIIMDPMFAKILLKTLEKNIKSFEEKFGSIKTPKKKSKREVVRTEPEGTTRYIG